MRRRASSPRLRRIAWAVGAAIIAVAVIATGVLLSTPRPDATLHRTDLTAGDRVAALVHRESPWLEVDGSTLRAYEPYRGLVLWSGVNAYDSPCLIALSQSVDVYSESSCAPEPAELFIDVSSWGDSFDGHPGDGIIRFIYRGDTVDAYIHYLEEPK